MKKAIIIGGLGFIGWNLAEHLKKKGFYLICFDIREAPKDSPYDESIQDDVRGGYLEERIIPHNPDVIFDCCGVLGTGETFERIEKAINVNIGGVVKMLELCAKHDIPIIYLTLINRWLNPYTITKRAATKFCMMFHKEFGAKVSVIGALNVYGKRQFWKKVEKFIPNFAVRAIRNEPLKIRGDGKQIVDAVHIDDISEAMFRAYEMKAWGKEIDIGSGEPYTINEIADMVIEAAGSKSKKKYYPRRIGEPHQSISFGNISNAKRYLDFRPKIMFKDGIKEVVEWYRNNLDFDK